MSAYVIALHLSHTPRFVTIDHGLMGVVSEQDWATRFDSRPTAEQYLQAGVFPDLRPLARIEQVPS